MPDIDLDFPDNKRQEVLDYVYRKYGDNHVTFVQPLGHLVLGKPCEMSDLSLGKRK